MPDLTEMDFNGESVSSDNGPAENADESKEEVTTNESQKDNKVELQEEPKTEEDIESLPQWAKDRLNKVEKDKENYKQGMLKYKNLTLDKKEEVKEEETIEYPEWDENSKKFQEQTLSQSEKKAEEAARKIVEKTNEKTAISRFVKDNPELASEDKWNEVISNYTPRSGKESPEDIMADLEEALVITRYRNGDLNKPGTREKETESNVADMSSVSKTTSKTVKEGNTLSEGAKTMAKKMRVNVEKLEKEDDSLMAEIDLTN